MIGRRRLALMAACGALACVTTLRSQAPAQQPPPQTPAQTTAPAATAKPESEDGIPITNPTVKNVCGPCHASDSKERMSRISYRRTTPEGWQETIRRMVTLNKAADRAGRRARDREVPLRQPRPRARGSEARGVRVERRLIDYTYSANTDTEPTSARAATRWAA